MALRAAASLEQYSRHPLAAAILEAARGEQVSLADVKEATERPGRGLTGVVGERQIEITGRAKVLDRSPGLSQLLPPPTAGMESVLLMDGSYAATFLFRDEPRPESRSFVGHLAPKHGVTRVLLLSGDRESEVLYLASRVGITATFFGKSPEEKVEIVAAEARLAPTLFLGDGINDAPAMQAATVGIAFGEGSDVTAEASSAVIFEPSLRKVDELIHIGRRMRRIALQSAVGGMMLSMGGMLIAAGGYLPPALGAGTQELIDIAALLNALRVALPGHDLDSDEM
jgi:P-type E1-E2 ATPase